MKFLITIILATFAFGASGTNQLDSSVWGEARIINTSGYEKFGELFLFLQGHFYFATAALSAVLIVAGIFCLHYLIIGPKSFEHGGKKILAFGKFIRIIHLIAAISWVFLVPTGFIIMFGQYFGGGVFVKACRIIHDIATVLFAIAVLPMFIVWIKPMLPKFYDIKWLIIVGGYLSKKKVPVPAGKFNAGQKSWFYIATIGGLVMIITGAMMFFIDPNLPAIYKALNISQIDILRLSAIIHNSLGALCAVFFLIHIYMSVFAIKGSIHAIITGYKEEDEVKILHSVWYKEMQNLKVAK